ALERVRELGMEPVLGDGISSELQCWMEGCVARHVIRNAGEFNGFLKPKARLFAEPLRFAAGELVLAAGYAPTIDADVLATHELEPRANSSREKHRSRLPLSLLERHLLEGALRPGQAVMLTQRLALIGRTEKSAP